MDLSNRHTPLRDLSFPPPPPPPPPIFHRASSTGTSFPILVVAVIGILATAFLLVSYYVFVIKCCLNWHRIDILRRFSLSRRRRNEQDPLMVYSPELRNRGLDDSVIRAIPIFKFKKRIDGDDENDCVLTEGEEKSFQECSVCLNEFQDEEKLRIIPNCCHLFHIDCIDVWLQYNANCPLCRTRVSCDTSFPPVRVSAPSTSPENLVLGSGDSGGTIVVRGENEYVIIELGNSTGSDRDSPSNRRLLVEQEMSGLGPILIESPQNSISPSPRKYDRGRFKRKCGKLHKITSMGDECIDIGRCKDEQFGTIQPIRRSISMDSSADRQMYLAVQEAIFRKNQEIPVVVGDGGSSSSGNVSNNRVKRSFFSFGSSRRSRSSSILPLYFEP